MNYILGYVLLLMYLFGFIIGFSVILYSIIYYIIERVAWLKYYIVFLFSFAFLLLVRAVKLLSFLTIPSFMSNNIFNILYFFTFSIAMSLMLYFVPAFLYRFLDLRWSFKENIIYISLSVIHFILSIFGILIKFDIYIFSSIIFYAAIFYLFVIGFINYKNIKDRMMKFIVKILGLITIIIYPILIYQLIIYRREAADIGSMDITLVLFYIWWNLVMLGYLSWYFINIVKSKNIFIKEDNNDNKNDIEENINLTRREKEILSYLLDGKTNKEVSLILDISLNTVNNHVANIYEKSGVKNRVELVNKFSR